MKVVGIGGGHGLAATLRAARLYADDITAVVSVADDGGSSGRLTAELGIPPPGDIRNCLVALAGEGPNAELFQHRFRSGTLEGHPVGNLVIAALAEIHGDFASAVEEAARMLRTEGRVFPSSLDLVRLSALVEGGVVEGQVAVAQTKQPIRSLHLRPSRPAAHPGAVAAIRAADQVVLGPGSLFTSVIATLLVPDIGTAVATTDAKRIFICNAREQRGETEGLSVADHVAALLNHLGPGTLDAVVVQMPALGDSVAMGERWPFEDVELIEADVAEPAGAHDPERLAKVLGAVDPPSDRPR